MSGHTPGSAHTAIPYGQLPDGAPLTIPMTTIMGAQLGPRVVVTAGVHGDEFEGVRAVAELSRELNVAQLRGTLVLVPVVNGPAFNVGQRISPLDGVNLNRVCPGNPHGTLSERLAHTLFTEVIDGADALVDLHSGGTRYLFQPQAGFYAGNGTLGAQSFALAQAFGLDLLWQLPGRQGVCSYAALQQGIPAIGIEIGGNGRCEPAHVALAKRGVQGVLTYLGMLDSVPQPPTAQRVWRGDFELCPVSGLFEPAVTLNQEVRTGDLLYCVRDLHGTEIHTQYATHDGLVSAIRIFAAIQAGEWDVAVLERVE